MNLNELTIKLARKGLDAGDFTSVELTQACLDRIAARNDEINAFITVTKELALAEAAEADVRIKAGDIAPLTGIPYGVKDAICVKRVRSTAAATILDNYVPTYDATVIANIRAQGAVLVGKQNCDSFGHGASNENSMYGAVKNPHDTTKVSGGSSGGSAAAVADHMCLFSIGEDTGGSIRQPASMCGVVGFRPSYGRNSRYGIMPMASSLDVVGPMAKTVEDAAIVAEVMAGNDPLDATTYPDAVPTYRESLKIDLTGLTIGLPKEYFELEGLDPKVKESVLATVKQYEDAGATVKEISLPHTKYAIPTYYIIVPSEDSSNLGRIDTIRYGSQVEASNLYDMYAKGRTAGFPAEVKRRIMIGTYALSAGYYDAYYRKAQKVRTLIRRDFDAAFAKVDVIMTPTSPFVAFGIGEKSDDLLAMYTADAFVAPSALAGIPSISVPVGNVDGLPVGMQIIGNTLQEPQVLRVANHFTT
jgi:aspartyl-tRNA(Asn)/glutamyl-tRNA(Gln) amidotransferase subunit A